MIFLPTLFVLLFVHVRSATTARMVILIPGTWLAQGGLGDYICIAFLIADVGWFDVWRFNVASTSTLQRGECALYYGSSHETYTGRIRTVALIANRTLAHD